MRTRGHPSRRLLRKLLRMRSFIHIRQFARLPFWRVAPPLAAAPKRGHTAARAIAENQHAEPLRRRRTPKRWWRAMAPRGVPRDLALRVYTTRLLGGDPRLVLHGGGNTSVKTRLPDLMGREVDVLCVKGSGADMAVIEPAGLPAVRLAELRMLRAREALSDEEMVRAQRANLLDPMAPNPSVETLLHAFVPHKFVDHTHATAVLSLIDQPDGEARAAELYDGRMGIVPYIMPGFALAKKAAEVFEAMPAAIGLILHKHGIFTFGDSAEEAYERMIEMVSLAEARLQRGRRAVFATAQLPQSVLPLAEAAPIMRGACSLRGARPRARSAASSSSSAPATPSCNFVNGAEVERYATAGVVTPDHTIRTKNWPLVLDAPQEGRAAEFAASTRGRGGGLHRELPALFRAQQCALRRHQEDARSAAARRAGAGPRPVRARPLQEGRAHRRRSRRGRRRDHHGCRSDRALRIDLRSRHVRLRILVARTGEARRRQGSAARRPDRGDHRRAPAPSAPRPRGPSPPPAPRSRCSMSTWRRRALPRRRSAARRSACRCDVTDPGSVRAAFAQGRGGVRRRRYRGVERGRRLAGPHRRGRRGGAAARASSSISTAISASPRRRCGSCWRRAPAAACCSTPPSRRSIRGRISAPTACPRRRPCSWPANTPSTMAPTASAPMPSMPTASAPGC